MQTRQRAANYRVVLGDSPCIFLDFVVSGFFGLNTPFCSREGSDDVKHPRVRIFFVRTSFLEKRG